MHLVDTHQHLWDLDQFDYSWCAGAPALNRSFLLRDYHAAASGLGITKTVFMEADVDEPHVFAEAQMAQSLADEHPLIAGIVASARPERSGFRAHLERLTALKKIRGIRRVLHTQADDLALEPIFSANLRLLPEFGLTFDLCALARQLPQAITLAQRCPEVTFILDHCGVPDIKGRAFDPWFRQIEHFASLPNVSCKISGLVAYTIRLTGPWRIFVLGSTTLSPASAGIACVGW